MDLHGLPESYLGDYVRRVHVVTPEMVKQVAAKHLDDARATIVVVGDRKVIEEQVKEYGKLM